MTLAVEPPHMALMSVSIASSYNNNLSHRTEEIVKWDDSNIDMATTLAPWAVRCIGIIGKQWVYFDATMTTTASVVVARTTPPTAARGEGKGVNGIVSVVMPPPLSSHAVVAPSSTKIYGGWHWLGRISLASPTFSAYSSSSVMLSPKWLSADLTRTLMRFSLPSRIVEEGE
jgi:hypothetical protein